MDRGSTTSKHTYRMDGLHFKHCGACRAQRLADEFDAKIQALGCSKWGSNALPKYPLYKLDVPQSILRSLKAQIVKTSTR